MVLYAQRQFDFGELQVVSTGERELLCGRRDHPMGTPSGEHEALALNFDARTSAQCQMTNCAVFAMSCWTAIVDAINPASVCEDSQQVKKERVK